mmetsp:Transcript_852/g.2529  ORF Transcript_852/g.2529 Transcript_852/m.2529 type:complete len:361 (+) Transcript_852:1335-2417(+)
MMDVHNRQASKQAQPQAMHACMLSPPPPRSSRMRVSSTTARRPAKGDGLEDTEPEADAEERCDGVAEDSGKEGGNVKRAPRLCGAHGSRGCGSPDVRVARQKDLLGRELEEELANSKDEPKVGGDLQEGEEEHQGGLAEDLVHRAPAAHGGEEELHDEQSHALPGVRDGLQSLGQGRRHSNGDQRGQGHEHSGLPDHVSGEEGAGKTNYGREPDGQASFVDVDCTPSSWRTPIPLRLGRAALPLPLRGLGADALRQEEDRHEVERADQIVCGQRGHHSIRGDLQGSTDAHEIDRATDVPARQSARHLPAVMNSQTPHEPLPENPEGSHCAQQRAQRTQEENSQQPPRLLHHPLQIRLHQQ